MTKLEIHWPDAEGEKIRAARGRLGLAFETLARVPFEQRLERVADIVEAWACVDSPWRRELAQQLETETPFHPATLAEGIESALTAWDRTAFVECARAEVATSGANRRQAPFECVSVLAGGSIPMPTILQTLLPLALGSPVLLRATSKDTVTGPLLLRCLAELDEDLARGVELLQFPSEDTDAMGAFLESPCIVATGSNETLDALRPQVGPNVRFVQYGHRFSIAAFGPSSLESPAAFERAVSGLALDVVRWDQLGCLSPVEVLLVGLDAGQRFEIAEGIADAIGKRGASMPRGNYSTEEVALHSAERAEARMRAAVNEHALCFEGKDWTLTLETDSTPRIAPLLRFLRLKPVPSSAHLETILRPVAPLLSTASIFGFEGEDVISGLPPEAPTVSESHLVRRTLTRFGVSRICAPGSMQTPPIDWPHDGMPLFLPMARFSKWT